MGLTNKIFCTAPFTSLRIESYSQNIESNYSHIGVMFKPGCVYDPSAPIPTLDEYLNGPEMTEHRNNLSNGTVPKLNCHRCSAPEKLGLQSIRLDLLKKPWASDEKKIYLLDVFFGNTCNLGCLMCGPEWSSFSSVEQYKAGIKTEMVKHKNNIPIALDTMDQLPDLKTISFIGGEFFLVKENSLILEKIIKRNLGATVITNASVLDKDLLQQLTQIKDLELRISIDGVQEVYEFIRYPASWNTYLQNVTQLRQVLPHAVTHFNIVIQPLNIQKLHEVFECNNKFKCQTHHQILHTPLSLSWPILLPEERVSLLNLLKQKQQQKFLITKQQRQTIDDLIEALNKVEYSSELRNHGIKWLSKLFKYRNIQPQIIKKVCGVFDQLSTELITAMNQTT